MSDSKQIFPTDFVTCMLIVNDMSPLTTVSIQSILNRSHCKIFIGFVNQADIDRLPKSDRIEYVNLREIENTSELPTVSKNNYQNFGSSGFYEIVMLKWKLIRYSLQKVNKFVIYCDVDVVWLKDAASIVNITLDEMLHINVLLQSFTKFPNDPLLCMGFVAIRKSDVSFDFLRICEEKHKILALKDSRIGDDEIATYVYKEMKQPYWLLELPQSTFPVGNFINLYSKRNRFPGMYLHEPIIFHSNYVIGLRSKVLLLQVFLGRHDRKEFGIARRPSFYFFYYYLKTRFLISKIKTFRMESMP